MTTNAAAGLVSHVYHVPKIFSLSVTQLAAHFLLQSASTGSALIRRVQVGCFRPAIWESVTFTS